MKRQHALGMLNFSIVNPTVLLEWLLMKQISLQKILWMLLLGIYLVTTTNIIYAKNKNILNLNDNSEERVLHSTKNLLRIGVLGHIDSIHPMMGQSFAFHYLSGFINRPIVFLDQNWQWQCGLCEKLSEFSPMRLYRKSSHSTHSIYTVDWKIAEGATWGDGTPVTGYDVFMSWKIGQSPFTRTSNPRLFTSIESIEVDQAEPKIFSVRVRKADYQHVRLTGFPVIARHIERGPWAKVGDHNASYENLTIYNSSNYEPGLFNGPYLIKKVLADGQTFVLSANPYFKGKKIAISEIVIVTRPSIEELIGLLQDGQIDMLAEVGQKVEDVVKVNKWYAQKPSPSLLKKIDGTDLLFEHLLLNQRNPILTDLNIRKALLYSIDRKSLITKFTANTGLLADSPVHPKDPLYSSRKEQYQYDLSIAAKLLDESGWRLSPSIAASTGGYRKKDNDILELDLTIGDGVPLRRSIAQELIDGWKKLGIKINLKVERQGQFIDRIVQQAKYTGMALLASHQLADVPPIAMLDSREIPGYRNKYQGQNSGAWISKIADANFDRLKVETDMEKRRILSNAVLEEVDEQVPILPLFFYGSTALTPVSLENYKITGHQYPASFSCENWIIK
ncbi:MAG: ABC transporter substrate-binding protein [Bdellovibrionota bacterium]